MILTTTSSGNPLLKGSGLPDFAQIKPEHVMPAMLQLLEELNQELTILETNVTPTWNGLVEPLERFSERLNWSWHTVSHLREVKNSPELRDVYQAVQPQVVQFSNQLHQNQTIYAAFKSLRYSDVWTHLNSAQKITVEAAITKAELSGVGLHSQEKQRFNEIEMELAELSSKFSNNLLDATEAFSLTLSTKEEIVGLPKSLLSLAAQASREAGIESASPENGPFRITLDAPSYIPFMQHSQNRGLREVVYKAYISRASEGELSNNPLIERILALRHEQACLLGFSSYAELSSLSKKTSSVDAVENLLAELHSPSLDTAKIELEELKAFAAKKGAPEANNFQHWDLRYWQKYLQEEKFGFSAEELRPYFPLEQVLSSLFALVNQLFSINVTTADDIASVWHEDVRYFQIADETGNILGYFYLDAYSRPASKLGGAWTNGFLKRARITLDGVTEIRLPVMYLVCNQTPPIDGKPSLMSFDEVITLFHEFGHCLDMILKQEDYLQIVGFETVEIEAVEISSLFMENWCYHQPTLISMARHYSSGEPLPEHYYQKLLAAKNFMSGDFMQEQLYLSYLDLELHYRYRPGSHETIRDVQKRIAETTTILPPLPENALLCQYRHIFDDQYASAYYSYLWAEVMSADAFAAFEEAGLDNTQVLAATGKRFRDTVFALRGSQHPMEIFKSFRGREPSTEALLRHRGLV